MKRNLLLFFICCGVLAAVASCKKGDPGVTGPPGQRVLPVPQALPM